MTIARPSPAPAWSSTAGAQSVAMAVHRAHDELATLGLGEREPDACAALAES